MKVIWIFALFSIITGAIGINQHHLLRHQFALNPPERPKPERVVCDTQQCKELAKMLIESMNHTVDPCKDFYEYACGNWKKHNPLPEGVVRWNLLKKSQRRVVDRLKAIVKEGPQPDDIHGAKVAKRAFDICMDTDAMDKAGLDLLVSTLWRAGGWPMIMEEDEWDENIYKWQNVDDYYALLIGENSLHSVRVDLDYWTDGKMYLFIKTPDILDSMYKILNIDELGENYDYYDDEEGSQERGSEERDDNESLYIEDEQELPPKFGRRRRLSTRMLLDKLMQRIKAKKRAEKAHGTVNGTKEKTKIRNKRWLSNIGKVFNIFKLNKIPTPVVKPSISVPQPKLPQLKLPQPKLSQPRLPQPKLPQPKLSQPKLPQPKLPQPKLSQPKLSQPKLSQPKLSHPKLSQPQLLFPDIEKTNPSQNSRVSWKLIKIHDDLYFSNEENEQIGIRYNNEDDEDGSGSDTEFDNSGSGDRSDDDDDEDDDEDGSGDDLPDEDYGSGGGSGDDSDDTEESPEEDTDSNENEDEDSREEKRRKVEEARIEYAKYIMDVSLALAKARGISVSEENLARDISNLIEFQVEIMEYAFTFENQKRMQLATLQRRYNALKPKTGNAKINWVKKVQDLFNSGGLEISEKKVITVESFDYIMGLRSLLDKTPSRTIVNYIHWNFISRVLKATTKEMRKLHHGWERTEMDDKLRMRECVEEIRARYIAGYEYVKRYMPDEILQTALDMVDDIQKEVEQEIKNSPWMDAQIRHIILDKLIYMKKMIGYPDSYRNITVMKEHFKGLSVTNSHYENTLSIMRYLKWENLKTFYTEQYPRELEINPLIVNAFFSPFDNAIEITAADFQKPLYDVNQPWYTNYGIIGLIMSHEVNHGFDNTGRFFNKFGNPAKWTTDMLDEYDKRAQCFIDQFTRYSVEEKKTANISIEDYGEQTAGENIADSMGLNAVFKAYQRRLRECNKPDPMLPGLEDLSNEQLFFLSFANSWCEVTDPEKISEIVQKDPHSVGPLRVIGSVSNSKDFAKAYNCPANSPMNPTKKCNIWI